MKQRNKRGGVSEDYSRPNRYKRIQFTALAIILLIIITLVIALGGNITVSSIIKKCELHKVLAAFIMLILFLLKCLTVFIPLDSLYLASGIVFTPFQAILLNYLGLVIVLTVPYFIGKWACDEEVRYLCEKYPKLNKFEEIQQDNQFSIVFVIRLIGGLPGDVLSFYFGANNIRYGTYLIASLCGYSVSLIMFTLLGDVIMNPQSTEFIVLITLRIVISVITAIITYKLKSKKKE